MNLGRRVMSIRDIQLKPASIALKMPSLTVKT